MNARNLSHDAKQKHLMKITAKEWSFFQMNQVPYHYDSILKMLQLINEIHQKLSNISSWIVLIKTVKQHIRNEVR